jgi:hypothetical protein
LKLEVEGDPVMVPLMKNCWPLAKNFEPLTEIMGIALMVEVRRLNARRTSVQIFVIVMA